MEINKPLKRMNWTREQLLIALNVYFKIPYSSITGSNPNIRKIAEIIGRTPDAVALKMCNFGSFDPVQQARGIKGLTNSGKLDKIIYDEFTNNWDDMLFESEHILASKELITIEDKYAPILIDLNDKKGEVKIREVKTRVNQDLFRKMILSIYSNKCAVTGIDISALLVAGHILPWANNEKERLNPANGICLSNLYDHAFEKGFIGIDYNYQLLISPELKKKSQNQYFENFFGRFENQQINLPDRFLPNKDFLDFHLNEVFKN